jgi:hypothetical protein
MMSIRNRRKRLLFLALTLRANSQHSRMARKKLIVNLGSSERNGSRKALEKLSTFLMCVYADFWMSGCYLGDFSEGLYQVVEKISLIFNTDTDSKQVWGDSVISHSPPFYQTLNATETGSMVEELELAR